MSRIIIFTATAGFRHQAIDAAATAMAQLAAEDGFETEVTDDAAIFVEEELNDVAATVWAHTSGTGLLNRSQRDAYEQFTRRGGGFAAVHAASDSERDWPLFDQLIGARFRSHPIERQLQSATVHVEGTDDPSVAALPTDWRLTDEWYAFDRNPRGTVEVLLTVDESTYDTEGSAMGTDHPIAWRSRWGSAKAWYTALGHEPAMYDDPVFRQHLRGGIASVVDHQITQEQR